MSLELPVGKGKQQVAYYLRRNARPFLEALLKKDKGSYELRVLF